MNRSKKRDMIIKVLYETYIYEKINIVYDIKELIDDVSIKNDPFIIDTITEIKDNEKEIIEIANKHMDSWNIERVGKVDKAIISLGIYELLYTATPKIVVIDEAIELSKKYSDEKVTKMINAMLDNIRKSISE